jgi:hypothetical protein
MFLLLPFALSSCGGSDKSASSANGTPANGATITAESPAIKASVMAADNCGTKIIEVGFGAGTETPATDEEIPNLPDFVTTKSYLETPWGVETYKYGWNETIKMKGKFENIGDGYCLSTDATQDIVLHTYLSEGYKKDPHSGDGAWQRFFYKKWLDIGESVRYNLNTFF